MEVRFLDSNRIYTGFLTAIREKFLTSDLRSKIHTASITKESNDPPPWESESPQNALDPVAAEKKRQQVQDWIAQIAKREPATVSPQRHDNHSGLTIHHLPDRLGIPGSPHPNPLPKGEGTQFETQKRDENNSSPLSPLGERARVRGEDSVAFSPDEPLVVQMLDRYLVMETEEGIALIDQHALHERILYEQLKEKIKTGQLPSQRLLVPVPVDLSPNEFSCVQENSEFFQTLGLHAEPFGGNTVLISALPAVLSKTPPIEILLSIVEPFLELGKKLNKDELLDELLHSMACKGAVKAGEKLSSQSIQHLMQLAESEINAHHCPHGRPSMLILTREEIDKMFERT